MVNHQIGLREEEKGNTAFSTKHGHWSYKGLVFGIKTALETLQRMTNTVLSGLVGSQCSILLGDTVVYGRSLVVHDNKLREILATLWNYRLKFQLEKCEFLRKEFDYLRHIIQDSGLKHELTKIKATEEFPPPTNVKTLKDI